MGGEGDAARCLQMTPEQARAALVVCINLAKMYLSIHLVRIDERTGTSSSLPVRKCWWK
jgi:hypothetical protein